MAFYSNPLCLCVWHWPPSETCTWTIPEAGLFTHLKSTLITYEQAIGSSTGPWSFHSQKKVLKTNVLKISDLIFVFSSATGCSKWSDLKIDQGMSKGDVSLLIQAANQELQTGIFISQFMTRTCRILYISVGLILWHVLYGYFKWAPEVRTVPCTVDKCCSSIVVLLPSFACKTPPCFSPHLPPPWYLFGFFIFSDLQNLKILGLAYFLYLFLFSGLEYTLSFLTHQRFHFSRYCNKCCIFWLGYFPKSSNIRSLHVFSREAFWH